MREDLFYDKIGETFEEFYSKNKPRLMSYLGKTYINTTIPIEEICNDAFVRMLEVIELFDATKASPRTYLYTIATNRMNYVHRYGRSKFDRKITYVDEYYRCRIADDDTTTTIKEHDEAVRLKFAVLEEYVNKSKDPLLKDIFYMALSGMMLKEIAKELNISMSMVKNHLYAFPKRFGERHKWENKIKKINEEY